MERNKKCPECQNQGKTSKVFSEGCSTTLLGYGGPYWDEDGNMHDHDPNWITSYYRCSNGHRWQERGKKECPTCKKQDNEKE